MKVFFMLLIIGTVIVHLTTARVTNYRIKRVTDNHLADLETKIALNNKLKGIVVTMPVGGGRIDPLRIGRKRRSESRMLHVLFNQSEEDKGDANDYIDTDYFNRYKFD